jgi:hypothetical protein
MSILVLKGMQIGPMPISKGALQPWKDPLQKWILPILKSSVATKQRKMGERGATVMNYVGRSP